MRPDSGKPARCGTACSRRNARPFAMSPCRDDRDVPPRPCGQRRRELRCVSARLANVRTGPQRAPPSFRQDDKPASISGRHRGVPAEPSPVSPAAPRPPDLCLSAPCEIATPSAMCALSLPFDSPHHSKIGGHICFLSDTVEFQWADCIGCCCPGCTDAVVGAPTPASAHMHTHAYTHTHTPAHTQSARTHNHARTLHTHTICIHAPGSA